MATRKRSKTGVDKDTASELEAYLPVMQELQAKWKTPVSKLAPDKRPFKTWLVFADTHVPHQNKAVMKVLYKLADDIKFDGVCILGDFKKI